MLLSASPALGGFYVLLLFFLSYFLVYALKCAYLFFKKVQKVPPPKAEKPILPKVYVLEKKKAPKRKSPTKKHSPKREVYYLSTLERDLEHERE